jgi:hypothetical protein
LVRALTWLIRFKNMLRDSSKAFSSSIRRPVATRTAPNRPRAIAVTTFLRPRTPALVRL